jgi:trans-aconitate methyltransferase
MRESEILRRLLTSAVDEETDSYVRLHAPRYATLLEVLQRLSRTSASPSILDVAPGPEVSLLASLTPVPVDTLGFHDGRFCDPAARHFEYDLNLSAAHEGWPSTPQYDVIVAGEVVEHLDVVPETVFAMLAARLTVGGQIVIQTPNACALPKRLAMLAGRNPFEMPRGSRSNPGHVREYTRGELLAAGRRASLRPVRVVCDNYFRRPSLLNRGFSAAAPLLPPTWRNGITVVFERT